MARRRDRALLLVAILAIGAAVFLALRARRDARTPGDGDVVDPSSTADAAPPVLERRSPPATGAPAEKPSGPPAAPKVAGPEATAPPSYGGVVVDGEGEPLAGAEVRV